MCLEEVAAAGHVLQASHVCLRRPCLKHTYIRTDIRMCIHTCIHTHVHTFPWCYGFLSLFISLYFLCIAPGVSFFYFVLFIELLLRFLDQKKKLALILPLSLLSKGMDPITRQVGQHIEMEPEWEAAFTLQMKLTHVISMVQDWCALDVSSFLWGLRRKGRCRQKLGG